MGFVSSCQTITFEDFLGSSTALDPWKNKKVNQKPLCFLTHVYASLQSTAKPYYTTLRRKEGTRGMFQTEESRFQTSL